MTDMTPASPTPLSKPKPRPRPQVMRLTDAAAQRITELTLEAVGYYAYPDAHGFGDNISFASALSPANIWGVGGINAGQDSIMHYVAGHWRHIVAKPLAGKMFGGIVAAPGGQVWVSGSPVAKTRPASRQVSTACSAKPCCRSRLSSCFQSTSSRPTARARYGGRGGAGAAGSGSLDAGLAQRISSQMPPVVRCR